MRWNGFSREGGSEIEGDLLDSSDFSSLHRRTYTPTRREADVNSGGSRGGHDRIEREREREKRCFLLFSLSAMPSAVEKTHIARYA